MTEHTPLETAVAFLWSAPAFYMMFRVWVHTHRVGKTALAYVAWPVLIQKSKWHVAPEKRAQP